MAYSPVGIVDKNIWDFDPRIIPGCTLWLDGADTYTQFQNTGATTPITQNGQAINAWKDKSINTLTFATTGIGANMTAPISAFNSQNGLPTISFTATGGTPPTAITAQGLLATTGVSVLPNGRAGGTYFAVSKSPDTLSEPQMIFSYGVNTPTTGQNRQLYYSASTSPGTLVSDIYGVGRSTDGTDYRSSYSILSSNMTAMPVIGATISGFNVVYDVTNTQTIAIGDNVTISGIAGGTFTGFNGLGVVQSVSPNASITVNISSTGTPTDFRIAIISGNNNSFDNGNVFSGLNRTTLESMNIGTNRATVGYGRFTIISTGIAYDAYGFNGNIAEILVYNNVLTTSERQQVEGYLAWKWGLQSNLANNHPYKNTYSIVRPLSRAFVPTDVSRPCFLWFDGADGSSLTLSGSNVTGWRDKSGNANNITSFSTSQPTYTSADNFLTFSVVSGASTTSGTTTNAITLTSISSYTIFWVIRFPSGLPTTGNAIFIRPFQQVLGSPVFFTGIGRGTVSGGLASFYTEYNSGNGPYQFFANSIAQDAMADRIFVCSFSQRSAATSSYIHSVNGNATPTDALRTSTMTLTSRVTIGSASAPAAATFTYGIGELLFYDGTLSVQERQRIEGYLVWKWGAQRTDYPPTGGANAIPDFPLTHPMRNFPSATVMPFSPTVITGLGFWIDAADTTSFTESGGSVLQLTDKSTGTNLNPTASAFQRVQTFNTNYPSFFGASAGGNGVLGTVSSFTLSNPSTIFAVYQNTATVGDLTYPYIFNMTNGTDRAYAWVNNPTPLVLRISAGVGSGGASTSVNTSVSQVTSLVINSTQQFAYQNGTLASTNSLTGASLTAPLTIGGHITNNRWTGYIAEVIIYNAALTAAQRQQVEGYLAWKWGLNTSLPTTHPYYKVPT